ncbi:MAG: deoxyhypusine synthase [Euryarchaeota archaeon]|jgi:deoxyhypusine synthase|nr:deoxyhypusine synthase [Euryarchaeota archaeon]MBT3971581.1 deoxyhypusine synthase [Euryarchaeota archaeon]MBT4406873.1 deoxyhypusine synthase [Euryarchaeota archaeon]MBT6645269.1 deoxyhypusine synthase [Euryarchaeota archaeon]
MNPRPLGPQGIHEMLDISGFEIPPEVGDEGVWMLALLRQAVAQSGAREVHHHVESFDGSISPKGFAAVVLLDESHVSGHCYSDLGIVAIDAFTCGGTDPKVITEYLLKELRAAIPSLHVEQSQRVSRFLSTSAGDNNANTEQVMGASRSSESIRDFIEEHYRHFNAGSLSDAIVSLRGFLAGDGKLLITLAGAMSTAEIGRSLAPLIRAGKVAGICTTGANLEEDIFNLIAHDHYQRIPNWRSLTAEDDAQLESQGMNRVTDTCIPEEEAIRLLENSLLSQWREASEKEVSFFPHEYLFQILNNSEIGFQADPQNSWLLAAAEVGLPIWTPGWEDSTTGNIFAAACLRNEVNKNVVKGGVDAMISLTDWYRRNSQSQGSGAGLLQVGGGIAGDFPICVVPMLRQDLGEDVPLWSWFAQISEATTSYGGYSGAPPNEKISWGKLSIDTPRFMIESDATIVLPLLFTAIIE